MNATSEEVSPEPEHYPLELQRVAGGGIEIVWSDQQRLTYPAARLRKHCPCATCREKRKDDAEETPTTPSLALPVLSAAETRPVEVATMQPVGRYAYNIAFSDGHNSGIFPLALLRELGEPA